MSEPIDLGAAIGLGALQGLTEFLPVSSSGHLAIGSMLIGMRDAPLAFSVLLHLGTLVATVVVLRADLVGLARDLFEGLKHPRELAQTESGRLCLGVIAATVPTVLVALALRDRVEGWGQTPWVVGVGLLGSAAAVLTTRKSTGQREELGLGGAVLVGIAQGLAVLPGLSRSGSTIAVAMLLGMTGPAAFRFSFLLSLPAVTGAVILELGNPRVLGMLGWQAWVGGGVSLVVGYVALRVLRVLVIQGRFWSFALYLVPLALGVIAWGAWG